MDIKDVREFVEEKLQGSDCFLVRADITGNVVTVEIDSDSRVDIDFVAQLNREIEERFAPEIDDYDLEVGSYGLTSPLKLPRQFEKFVGNDLEVIAKDGKKYKGLLKSADTTGFTLICEEKVKKEGAKRPVVESVERRFDYPDVKSAIYSIKF